MFKELTFSVRSSWRRFSGVSLAFSAAFMIIYSCTQGINYKEIPARSENGKINCVIEIPAGTNVKIEYDPETQRFIPDKRHGKDRVISYLPYPANYGFIPGTLSDPGNGGDGDAVDVVVLSSSLPSGTVIEVIPIGMLRLIDQDEQDYKILAIPADPADRIMEAENLTQLVTNYSQVLEIIESWFLNYDKDETISQGWANEQQAMQFIESSTIN
jgi:inorganic pyrophosphatase